MDQISDQFHQKMHSLETMFLDTDDLLWEVNHKAYQDDPKIMEKLQTDLKSNFSGLRKKVIDISKLMKNYIDSDVITENVAVKFMKFMSKKHHKKSQNAHDISLTEVLDFLNSQSKMRHMKKNEKQVFKNAEMLNSFLLSKHFQFDSDDSASTLYKQSKNSFEKTIKNAIGLSNFISSFGQILSSKLLNSEELSEIKTRARETKDVPNKKQANKTISFELYQIPSKNQNNELKSLIAGNAPDSNDRALGTNSNQNKASLDSGMKPAKNRKGGNSEDEELMPSIKELIAKKKKRIEMDKKRFSHKKISYKISEDEKLKKQNKLDIEKQTPKEIENVDMDGNTEIEIDESPLKSSSQVSMESGSHEHSGSSKTSGTVEDQDASNSQNADSEQSHDQIETDSQMSADDQSLNPSHFSLEASPLSSHEQSAKSGDSSAKSGQLEADLEMDKNLHIDKTEHILDTEDGDYDENDPHEIQELDKEEARLKKLEKLGYPKVEKIDLEVKKPLNAYGLHAMSLTSSVKKFDGNPDANNAYKTLNEIMSTPFQEMKDEYQQTKEQVTEADPNNVEMVEPQPHMNTLGLSMDEGESLDLKRGLRQREPTYQQMKQNYMNQMQTRRPRNLRQVSLSSMPFVPLKRNYSDKDMFKKRSFLPQKELNPIPRARPAARNLLDNYRKPRPVRHKNLKQKTDALYAKMLKMRF